MRSLLRIALGAGLLLGRAAFGADGGPAAATEVIRFEPKLTVAPVAGYCWAVSEVSPRPGAWRCKVDNLVLDPCFSVSGNPNQVACVDVPDKPTKQMLLSLSSPLPFPPDEQPIHPWFLVLEDGTRCAFAPKGSGVMDPRISYQCLDGRYLLGPPKPGNPWTAEAIRLKATKNNPGATLAVRRLWY